MLGQNNFGDSLKLPSPQDKQMADLQDRLARARWEEEQRMAEVRMREYFVQKAEAEKREMELFFIEQKRKEDENNIRMFFAQKAEEERLNQERSLQEFQLKMKADEIRRSLEGRPGLGDLS